LQAQILESWQLQDQPEHLRTIRDRILKSERQPVWLLKLYQKKFYQGEVVSDSLEERELLFVGISG